MYVHEREREKESLEEGHCQGVVLDYFIWVCMHVCNCILFKPHSYSNQSRPCLYILCSLCLCRTD